jgi:hypothetical protein
MFKNKDVKKQSIIIAKSQYFIVHQALHFSFELWIQGLSCSFDVLSYLLEVGYIVISEIPVGLFSSIHNLI